MAKSSLSWLTILHRYLGLLSSGKDLTSLSAELFCKPVFCKFSYFSMKTCFVTTHLNQLIELIQMSGHNTWFHGGIRKLAEIQVYEESIQQAKG